MPDMPFFRRMFSIHSTVGKVFLEFMNASKTTVFAH